MASFQVIVRALSGGDLDRIDGALAPVSLIPPIKHRPNPGRPRPYDDTVCVTVVADEFEEVRGCVRAVLPTGCVIESIYRGPVGPSPSATITQMRRLAELVTVNDHPEDLRVDLGFDYDRLRARVGRHDWRIGPQGDAEDLAARR